MLDTTRFQRFARRHAAPLLSVSMLALLTACASAASPRGSPVDLSVVDRDSGRVLQVYTKDGRSYVAGRPGARYAIRLSNTTGARVLAVLSVDGINVISGQTADPGQTGYVLDPCESYDITGWRKSDTAVAAFEFAALRDSYAAQTGRPSNVGVIGVAAFLEKPVPPPVRSPAVVPETSSPPAPAEAPRGSADFDSRRAQGIESSAAAAPAAKSGSLGRAENKSEVAADSLAKSTERLGTGHGQRERSVTTHTAFERATNAPRAVIEIGYDSYENLVAAGIVPRTTGYAHPRSFPNVAQDLGYVPDPPRR